MKYSLSILLIVSIGASGQSKKVLLNYTRLISNEKKDSIVTLASSYFETKLSSTTHKDGSVSWTAYNNISNSKGMFICTPDGKIKVFTNPVELLDILSSGGYEMVSQDKKKYHIDYTFKRK